MSDTHVCLYYPDKDDKRCWVTSCRYNSGAGKCQVDGIVPNNPKVREANPWNRPAEVDIGGVK